MRRWAAALVPAALALAVFHPILSNGYVAYDDLEAIIYNDRIRGLGAANLRWMLGSFDQSTWQPLPWLVYALIHAVQGSAPFGYHLFMLLLHSLNAALVALLFFELAPNAAAAALAGALFALHPLQTESVASAASISDMMAATFSLGSLLAYARSREDGRPLGAWLLSCTLFACAALCRWQAISVAAAAPLLDWARGRRLRARRLAPFFAGALALGLVYARVKAADLEGGGGADLGAAAAGVLVYVEKLLAPLAYLPFYTLDVPPPPWSFLFPAAAAALTAGLAFLARRRREPLAAWLFFLAFVAPTLALRRDDVLIARDRYAYLAFLGVYAAAAAGWLALSRGARSRGARTALAAAPLLLLACLGSVSRRRALAWRDAETYWTSVLAAEPRVYIARPIVGAARIRRGDFAGAASAFSAQLEAFPNDRRGAYLLAVSFAHGEPDAAFAPAKAMGVALGTPRERAAFLTDAGFELTRCGLYLRAAAFYERALELNPDEPKTMHNLAYALAKLGERERAAGLLRRALELAPDQEASRRLLATATR